MKKICVVLLSSALIIALLCQPAFALLYTRSSTKWVLANSFGSSNAFRTSNDTVITSYDEWCDFYPEICDAVADGYYSGVDSAALPHNTSFTYNGRNYMYIEIRVNNWTYYLCNSSGGRFLYCPTGGTTVTPKPDLPEIELPDVEMPSGQDYSSILYSIASALESIELRVRNGFDFLVDLYYEVCSFYRPISSIAIYTEASWNSLLSMSTSIERNFDGVTRQLLKIYDRFDAVDGALASLNTEVTSISSALYATGNRSLADVLYNIDCNLFALKPYIQDITDICQDTDAIRTSADSAATVLQDIYNHIYTDSFDNEFGNHYLPLVYYLEETDFTTVAIKRIVEKMSNNLTSVISDGKLVVDNSSIVDKIDEYFGGSEKRKGIYYWASINYANLSLATSHLFEAKSALAHIRDSLDSVISDGTLKVDNTSVVTAIQSLESTLSNLNVTATFDDSNVIKAVNTVDATLDTGLLQVYNSAERLRTTVSEGNTIQRGILNVVSTSDATLSEISGKLDMQDEYYTSLVNFYGAFDDYFFEHDDSIYDVYVQVSGIYKLLQKPLTVNTDLSPVITSIDAVGLNIEDLNANFNTNIGSLLDKLDIVIEGSSESLENRINVTIDASNDAHNVFYVTGEDGEEQSVTEFTGDLTKASGRLLSLLYRLVFSDALSTVDGDLDGFEDFFTSQGDDTATQSMESLSEEENVWLVS